MSSETPNWKSEAFEDILVDGSGRRFAIVVARFNEEITSRMLAGAKEALREAGAESFDVYQVPGAFELPFAALRVAKRGEHEGIVALGCVIRGDTPHFEYVAAEAARGLQQVALTTGVPVGFGVLTTDTREQALERAGGAEGNTGPGNKGYDAAMTTVAMSRFGA